MAGHSTGTRSAQQQQHEAEQDAQIADMQQTSYPQQQAPAPYAPPPQYASPQYAAPPPVATTPAQNPVEVLKQLGELKAAGVLTEEEFESKKAELLKQI